MHDVNHLMHDINQPMHVVHDPMHVVNHLMHDVNHLMHDINHPMHVVHDPMHVVHDPMHVVNHLMHDVNHLMHDINHPMHVVHDPMFAVHEANASAIFLILFSIPRGFGRIANTFILFPVWQVLLLSYSAMFVDAFAKDPQPFRRYLPAVSSMHLLRKLYDHQSLWQQNRA